MVNTEDDNTKFNISVAEHNALHRSLSERRLCMLSEYAIVSDSAQQTSSLHG
jgi:hypothetical protein